METIKIKKINKGIFKDTYDITVKNNHNFFCNDYLIHNCDYRGQLCVILINTSKTNFEIKDGDRIGQGILNKVEQIEWVEVNSVVELGETVRGDGGFGSTDRN